MSDQPTWGVALVDSVERAQNRSKGDIQAALTVIGRRVVIGKGAPDLSQARTQSADLFSPVFKECLDALFVWFDPPMNQHDVHMAVRPFYSFYTK
jgi:hypothetical protein